MGLRKFFVLLSTSLFAVSNIFLFGPFTIYQGNADELIASLTYILISYVLPALILISLLIIVGLFLPESMHRRYVSILFAFGALVWLQANILVWNYGILDGQGIDWSEGVWRGWLDGLLWVLLLIAAYRFCVPLYKTAAFASVLLLLLQMVLLVSTSFQKPDIWDKQDFKSADLSPPDAIYEYSSERNVIHILLDGFQSDIFHQIIDKDPDHYYSVLEGFTFFRETTGSFAFTQFSIPAYLSGEVYRNNVPIPDFMTNVLGKGKTIPTVLHDHGYDVDIVHARLMREYSNYYRIPTPYRVTEREFAQSQSALVMDLVLFRSVPHFVKKFIYNNQSWLIQPFFSLDYTNTLYFSHREFLQDMIDNMSIDRAQPLYKYLHLMNAHGPPVVTKDCKYAGGVIPWSRENVTNLQKCSLDHVIEFLTKLKSLGIYDSSLIILSADHGRGTPVKMQNENRQLDGYPDLNVLVGQALPLMVIKAPNAKGPLKISNSQTQIIDLPATVSSLLELNEKFGGRSMFDGDTSETRERRFYFYNTKAQNYETFLTYLDEFIIRGSAFDKASWQMGSTYRSPAGAYYTNEINFGTEEAHPYLLQGWGKDHTAPRGYTYNWAMGSSASLLVPLLKDETVTLTANIRSARFDEPQIVTVKVDGAVVGHWEFSAPEVWQNHSVVIEPDRNRPDASVVDFEFSQHLGPEEYRKAVVFESIKLRNGDE